MLQYLASIVLCVRSLRKPNGFLDLRSRWKALLIP